MSSEFQGDRSTRTRRPGRHPTDKDWADHKLAIRDLYLKEDYSHKRLIEYLADFNIKATKAQVGYKLKAWGYRKNLSKASREYVASIIDERKRLGEKIDVLFKLSGKELSLERIQRATRRCRDLCRATDGLTLALPKDFPLTIHAPSSEIDSNREEGPWMQFVKRYQDDILSISSNFAEIDGNPRWPGSHGDVSKTIAVAASRYRDFLRRLPTKWEATLSAVAGPKCDHGSGSLSMTVLSNGLSGETIPQRLGFVTFALSNGFDVRANQGEVCDDCTATMALRTTARPNGNVPPLVGSWSSLTALAIRERLFVTTIETHMRMRDEKSLNMALWLLEIGQDPNNVFKFQLADTPTFGSPLELAVDGEALDLARCLLTSGANPNLRTAQDGFQDSPLEIATKIRNEKVSLKFVRLLLDRGAQPSGDSLLSAISGGHIELTKLLLSKEPALLDYEKALPDSSIIPVATPMSCASTSPSSAFKRPTASSVELLKYILEERGLHAYDDGPERRLIDCLLSAAASGNQAVVEFLCTDNGLNVASCNDVGLSALHAAAASGHHRLCEYLLSHGATVTALRSGCPSALHLAAFFGQLDVVALLLNHTVAVRTHVSINIGPDAFARHFALPTKVLESDGDWRRVKTPVDAALWRIPTHCPDDPRCQRKRRCATYLIESGAALSGGEVALGVLFGDENLTLAALEAGSDPDQTLVSGETALQAALAAGLELVSFELLELGAQLRGGEIQSAMKIGRADLLHAVKSRYRELRLPIGRSLSGETLLESAVLSGDKSMIQEATVLEDSRYDSGALCAAVLWAVTRSGHDSQHLVRCLLNGRPRTSADVLEGTAIAIAAQAGRPLVVKELISRLPLANCCISPVQWTYNFSKQTGGDWLNLLKTAHCSGSQPPFWRNPAMSASRVSPLLPAMYGDIESIVNMLLDAGYRPDRSCLLLAVQRPRSWRPKIVASYDPAYKESLWHAPNLPTPLRAAAAMNDTGMTQLLLEKGEDVNQLITHIPSCRTPLQQAAESGHHDMVKLLLRVGADVNAQPTLDGGGTALQLASSEGFYAIVRVLLQNGADVNARRAAVHGRTALEAAAESGRLDTVHLLLRFGASTMGTGQRQYLRAIRLAQGNGFHAVAELLMRRQVWTADHIKALEDPNLLDERDLENAEDPRAASGPRERTEQSAVNADVFEDAAREADILRFINWHLCSE